VSVGTNLFAVERSVDDFGRLSGRGVAGWSFQALSYTAENRVGGVSSDGATVAYAYADDGSESGCSVVLSGGAAVVRQTVRDAYRPNLVSSVSNFVNGIAVSGFDFQYDAEGRVLSRNADAFSYNARGEVTGATLGGQVDSYAYDQIGNFTGVVSGGVTNSFSANELNQYVSMGVVALSHTPDGGISTDGLRDFAYDSAGRLSSVSTGGVAVAAFQYDAFGRRVRKTTQEATHTYLYDGWNLVLERIERDGGETDTVEYFWGKDISGSLGGAGGIGALLYLKHNGDAYVPIYDANGNVVQYVDATGAIVASYVYDAFGRTLASAGSQAELFRFRFSTKYHDSESGLVYFGYRFYSPSLARWLTRDPLEEQGGLNLYEFCGNDAIGQVDPYGLATEGSGTYDKIVAFMEKMGVQLFWWNVAEKFFKGRENCPISAEMLKLAITGYVGNGRYVFPENGQLAGAIQDSAEYKNIIDNLVHTQATRLKTYKESNEPINFNTKDLKTAVGHASYNLEGDICKTKSGSRARLNLHITVLDTYDFHMWGKAEIEANGAFLSFGNNLAYQSQQKGYLKTYPWSVSFDDNRRWPWHAGSQLVR
jgi:RHS repeat-associated protein